MPGKGHEDWLEDVWDRLADAVLITGRTDKTIQAWCAAGEIGPQEYRIDRGRRQGTGHAYYVLRSALRRVHFAHDGTYWNPAVVRQRWPASAVAYIRQLEARVAELEELNAKYRRVIGTRWSKGTAAVADMLEELADTDAAAPPAPRPIASPSLRPAPSATRPVRSRATKDWEPLPADYVSANSYGERHGFPKSSWRAALSARAFEVIDGQFTEGQTRCYLALDAACRRSFIEWATDPKRRSNRRFVRCGQPGCECAAVSEHRAGLAAREPGPTLPREVALAGRPA
jgi:hypothetical protein